MYQWTRMYMRHVMILLSFIRSTRKSYWFLYLASLEKMCPAFFSYNRFDYAQNIPAYIANMHDLEVSSPEEWKAVEDGNFTVQGSNVPFTAIGIDHAQEYGNK